MNDEWLQRSDQAVRKWKRCQKEAVKLFEDEYQYLTHDNSSVQDRAISEMLYIQKTGDYPYDDVQRVVKYLNRQAHICSQMNPDVLPDKSPIILLLHEKMANAWERGGTCFCNNCSQRRSA